MNAISLLIEFCYWDLEIARRQARRWKELRVVDGVECIIDAECGTCLSPFCGAQFLIFDAESNKVTRSSNRLYLFDNMSVTSSSIDCRSGAKTLFGQCQAFERSKPGPIYLGCQLGSRITIPFGLESEVRLTVWLTDTWESRTPQSLVPSSFCKSLKSWRKIYKHVRAGSRSVRLIGSGVFFPSFCKSWKVEKKTSTGILKSYALSCDTPQPISRVLELPTWTVW